MSAPVDVLAALRARVLFARDDVNHAVWQRNNGHKDAPLPGHIECLREKVAHAEAVRAAVAELIEADKELDAANAELTAQTGDDDDLYLGALKRHQRARERRAAALARVSGEGA
jgi:hypothetical protein